MSSTASPDVPVVRGDGRVDVLFGELSELTGQRNAIDGRIVEIVAELDRDELCGATGARSVAALVAWKLGVSSANASTIATVALCPYHHRLHHRGVITITGPAEELSVTDSAGRPLSPGSLARPPTRPPPAVPPCPGPTGERADWWWYQPFQPQPPPTLN